MGRENVNTSESSDGFEPINEDHAVKFARFSLYLSDEVTFEVIHRLKILRSKIIRLLPAYMEPDDGRTAHFAFLRPDGSRVWSLSVKGNVVVVECTRYTRWNKVYSIVSNFHKHALEAISLDSYTVDGVGFEISDRFKTKSRSPNLSSVLNECEFVPEMLFRNVPNANYEITYTKDIMNELSVRSLKIDTDIADVYSPDSEGSHQEFILDITHRQVMPLSYASHSVKNIEDIYGTINKIYGALHYENKLLLGCMLTPYMKRRIGLEVG